MSRFYPDYRFRRIWEIPADFFASRGIEALLLDADNTLREDNVPKLEPEAAAWLQGQKERGLRLFVVSNNARHRSAGFAAQTGMESVNFAVKPFAGRVRRALRKAGLAPERCAVIGDQVLTDVLCGKNLGSLTVLVEPFAEEHYGLFLIKRPLERRLLRGWEEKGRETT